MTPVEWMTDPNLCGSTFGGASWGEARALVGSIYAVARLPSDLEVALRRTERTCFPDSPFRRVFIIARRGDGKTIVAAFLTVYSAAHRDYRPLLGPGEIAVAMLVACDRRQARQAFNYCRGLIAASPMLEQLVVSETQDSITLSTGVRIEVHVSNFRSVRGYSLVSFVADELAFWRSEDSATPDVEVFRAVAPGLARIPGSLSVGISTPYGRRGLLWENFKSHYGRDDSPVLVWRTAGMNPTLDEDVIREAFESDPEAAKAEWGAEFRSDLQDYVSAAALEAVTVAGRLELPPSGSHRYAAFIDPSGGAKDSMTLAIAHRRFDDVGVLDVVLEVRPPFDPRAVVADFAETLKRYSIRRVWGDRYAGEWVRVPFREHGITYELAEAPKSDIYRDFLPLIMSRRVELLDHSKMLAQLASLERRTGRGGRDTIDHAPGAHDDVANAVAGALCLVAPTSYRPAAAKEARHQDIAALINRW